MWIIFFILAARLAVPVSSTLSVTTQNGTELLLPANSCVLLNVTVNTGQESVNISIDNRTVSNFVVSSFVLVKLMPDNFSSFGAHELMITGQNAFFFFPLLYEEMIGEMTVAPSQAIFLHESTTNFTVSVNNGSNLLLHMFSFSQESFIFVACSDNKRNVIVPYEFNRCKTMDFEFVLTNGIYKRSWQKNITLVPNAKEFNVTFLNLFIVPPDSLQISIHYKCNLSQTNVTATLIIGNQAESPINLVGMNYTFTKTNPPPGKYNASVVISTPLNSAVFSENVTITTNASLGTNKREYFVGEKVHFTVNKTTINLTSCKINISDAIDKWYFEKPVIAVGEVFLETYYKEGAYNISWTLSCEYFMKTGSLQIFVYGKLIKIIVDDKYITIPDGVRKFNISVQSNGSVSGECTVNYGDGTGQNVSNLTFPTNFILQTNYTKVNNYTFHVKCIASLNSLNATALTQVTELNLDDFTLNYSAIVPLGSTSDFALIYRENKDPPPKFVTSEWDFGDGVSTGKEALSSFHKTHLYKIFGNYSGFLSLASSNHIRKIPFNIQAGIFDFKIENTTILAGSNVTGSFQLEYQITDSQFTYDVTFNSENDIQICIKTVNLTSSPIPFTCQIKNGGVYSGNGNTNGSSFKENITFNRPVIVINPIKDLKIGAPERLSSYESLKLTVSAGGQTLDIFNVTCEFALSSGQNQSKMGDITKNGNIIKMEFVDLQIGQIRIHVYCFNELSSEDLFKNITVSNDCWKTSALFMKMNRHPLDPLQLRNSQDNLIKSSVEIKQKCETFQIFYLWTFRKKNITKGASLMIPQDVEPGLYRIDLNVSLANITQTDYMYINLSLPELEAIIQGGSIIMIPKGNLLVDAVSLSYDPSQGQGNTTGLSFIWSCRMSTTRFDPDFNVSSIKFSGTPGCPLSLPNVGKLNISSSDVEKNNWYIFQVHVSKGNRTAIARQAIFITPQKIIPLEIGCVINCFKKMAANREAIFEVNFTDTSLAKLNELTKTPRYTWKVSRIRSAIMELLPLHHDNNTPQLKLMNGSLEEDANYQLKVILGNITGYAESFAITNVITNRAPQNGNCTVRPWNGTIGTRFKVNCFGWQDSDGIHKYVIVFQVVEKQLIIGESQQAISSEYSLPIGDENNDYRGILTMRVYDNFEAFSQINYTIQVKPDERIAEKLLNDASLTEKMEKNPESVVKNAGNVISTLNTIKTPSLSNNSVANLDQMPEEEINNIFSQSATQVNEKWNSVIDSLSDEKDEKQEKVEKKLDEMTSFMTEQMLNNPPTSETEIQEKAEVFTSFFENKKLSHLNSAATAVTATTQLGEILSDLSQKKPIGLGLQKTIHSVTNLVGKLFDQITPEEPLPSEPMTFDRMRKKLEQEFPDPDSPINIEERTFLAFKNYQREQIKAKKQLNISKSAVPQMMKSIDKITKAMYSLTVTDGDPVVQYTKNLKIGQWKISSSSSSKSFQLQSGQSVEKDNVHGPNINMVVFTKNPYMNEAGSENLKDVISFSEEPDPNKMVRSTSGKVVVSFKHDEIKWKTIQPKTNSSEMIIHSIYYRSKSERACVKMMPVDKNLGYMVYMRSHEYPTLNDFNYRIAVEPTNLTDGVYTICFPANTITDIGYIYVGMQPFEVFRLQRSKRSTDNSTQTMNRTYSFGSLVAGCSVLNDKTKKWTSDGCKPKYNKKKSAIECECSKPVSTIFSNSFYVPPNSIDFSTVFGKFDLLNNGAAFGVVIAFICIYLILLIVTWHYDRKDFIRWSIVPLVDNVATDPFWYVISVSTGLQYGSGTKSRINFKVAGEIVDTQIHSLTEGHQKAFNTGSILKFLMSTNESLGHIQYLHIWHDNSGSGDSASWYLNKIEITDLQTSENYVFLCNSWLAVEEGDGSISRVLPVSTGNELLSFNNKFFEHTRQKITDEHIWLSIMFRPMESPFNRRKRLSTAFALLFLTMISNAMFYSKAAQFVEIGPIRVSFTMIWTSFMGIIISTLPIIIIMTLFKKSKNKPKQSFKKSPPGELLEDSYLSSDDIGASGQKMENLFEESEGKTLPWFCVYIAWVLVALSISAPGFFIILYSQEWGKEKSEEWLTAFFFSFFESCFIVDPLKVIVVSIILSFFSKKLIKNKIAKKKIEKISNHRETLPSSWSPPLSPKIIEQARAKRRSDLRMREVIQDLFLYVVFLWVIYSLSMDNRDPHAFEQSQQLDKVFKVTKEFKQIQTDRHLLKWINSTFFPNFFPQRNYKGTTLQPLRKLFASDQTNFRMGPARFRLLRMKSETCKIPYIGTVQCFDNYNILTEDTDGYCMKWKLPPCPPDQEATTLTFSAWNFTSATEIWGLPFMGTYSLYGGGGYILNLEINLPISIKMLEEITQNLWIDQKSRALFVEFTLYNANVNLFTYVMLLAEIPNIGEILPYTFFYSFKALADENDGMIFVCQLLFLVFILMMLIRSLQRMFHMKWTFLNETWYVLDFLSALSCSATVGMYVMRSVMVKQAQEQLKANPKEFVNFYHIVVWDLIFVALMAILVFVSTIRFLRILGYNKRISAIGMVVTSAKKDMSGFFILFIIMFWTFSSFGYLIFGRELENYKSIWNSMTAMFVGILGKTNYSNLKQTRHAIGPFFYLVFVFVFIFFLLRMVESILNDSIQKVNNQMSAKEESMFRYLYDQMPKYIRKILFPTRENVYDKKTDSEFCDVRIIAETKNNLTKKAVNDATEGLKSLNLSSFDMMYHLISKHFDESLKETSYAETDKENVNF